LFFAQGRASSELPNVAPQRSCGGPKTNI